MKMFKQLASVFVVGLLGCALADDTQAPQKLTEAQAKEVIFTVGKQLVAEVNDAVKTINDVFGYPGCEGQQQSTRSDGETRGWKGALAGAALGAVLGKRQQESDEKRGWKGALAGAALGAALGKREQESDEKRGWKAALAGAAIGAALGKREQESDEKRGWKAALAGAAIGAALGRRNGESDDDIEKKLYYYPGGWGKRDSAEKREWRSIVSKRDAPAPEEPAAAESQGDSSDDEVQFEADVAKLKEAVSVLNEVLLVAEASLNN